MSEWTALKLPDCLEKTAAVTKIPKKKFLVEGPYPIVSQEKGVINGYWNEKDDVVKVESPLIVFGDHTQILKHIDFDFVVGADGVKLLQPKSFLDSKYLFYFLMGNPVKTLGYARHYRLLKELDVRYPSFTEQKRIVAILDEAFAGIDTAIANTEKNLANARELFDSYLNSVFTKMDDGWLQEKMSDVCEGKITDGTHQTPKYFEDGYIFLSSRNVTTRSINWDKIKYIDESQHVAMQKRLSPRVNDILLAKNGTTGVAAIVDRDVVFDIYVSLALLRPSEKILPRYLLHFVNSPVAKEQFNKRLKGVGVPNLHLNEIREVLVSYPENIEEQEIMVNKIDDLLAEQVRLESIYQQKLASLNELKQSLLQKAFSGELTAEGDKLMDEAVA